MIVWPEPVAKDAYDEDDEDQDQDQEFQARELRMSDQADQLAGGLAAVTHERAVAYARRYADLDLLLADVDGHAGW